ncbi:MAG: hypothetical protein RIM99_12125 [Cyclobacteriaceae bacterium]
MNNHAIYIFTCNRPTGLERLAIEVASIQGEYSIHIIDDSSETLSIKANRKIANQFSNTRYLGIDQFNDFYKINEGTFNQMLGDNTWNLGIARNFALEHSVQRRYKKVLFIDDDISGINQEKIDEGFSTLTENNLVSCNLLGQVDDSIIGHIATEVGVTDSNPRMLSGGFFFLTPLTVTHRFFNIYNEDWILQLLEKEKEKITIPFEVYHSINRNLKWTLDQALFQEFGELVVEGFFENDNALFLDSSFWNKILQSRIKFIEEIISRVEKFRDQLKYDICIGVLTWLKHQNGNIIKQSIEEIKNEYYEYKI